MTTSTPNSCYHSRTGDEELWHRFLILEQRASANFPEVESRRISFVSRHGHVTRPGDPSQGRTLTRYWREFGGNHLEKLWSYSYGYARSPDLLCLFNQSTISLFTVEKIGRANFSWIFPFTMLQILKESVRLG